MHIFCSDHEGWEALVAAAGYNPAGMITFFQKLLLLDPTGDGATHWDSTHPGTSAV